jgi:2-oxoglutarate ferredoxin oxidoreductase subunit beta
MSRLELARQNNEMITGLLYIDPERPSLAEISNLGDTPLALLPGEKIRPSRQALISIMDSMR